MLGKKRFDLVEFLGLDHIRGRSGGESSLFVDGTVERAVNGDRSVGIKRPDPFAMNFRLVK